MISIKRDSPSFALDIVETDKDNFSVSVCSFNKSKENEISFYRFNDSKEKLHLSVPQNFPITSCTFSKQLRNDETDYILVSSDNVKLFVVENDKIQPRSEIKVNKTSHPITSVDWYSTKAIASSLDSTVTILDMNSVSIITRIMAHEHPVNHTCFCNDENQFVTGGFDGSLRGFDLRDLSSLDMMYQSSMPILRCDVSKLNPNYVAFFSKDSCGVTFIDRRRIGTPLSIANIGDAHITGIAWSLTDENVLYMTSTTGNVYKASLETNRVFNEPELMTSFSQPIESIASSASYVAVTLKDDVKLLPI